LGKRARVSCMSKQDSEKFFPILSNSGYSITSPATPEYNCIAWAASDTNTWWEPDPQNLYYWPPEVSRKYTLDSYIKAYEILGYTLCHDANYKSGFEKIAIYVNANGKPTHAARQLNSGTWTSKLGRLEDIEHATLDDISGFHYGSIAVILKKPKKDIF